MVAPPTGGRRSGPNLALCHEWLAARNGSEKTFEAMAGAFPTADLYGLTWDRTVRFDLGGRPVSTTFLDRVPALKGRRMFQLPLMPLAWRYASRRRYDVVVTSSHACAKGFWPARQALHLCYCYTPMRYLWLSAIDTRRRRTSVSAVAERLLRSWDLASVEWVDEFAAISTAVADRINSLYGRDAVVIHPPVDTDFFTPTDPVNRGGFALAASRMVPYKRLDLAIRVCHRVGHPLVVAGSGPAEPGLRALADELAADVRFVIEPDDARLRELYRTADLLVFPAEEDFGIVPVEAQACGTPVVAYGRGGALDTVLPGVTGELAPNQDVESLAAAMVTALDTHFDPAACRRNAERFSVQHFQEALLQWVIRSSAIRGIHVPDPRTPQTA